MLLAWWRRFRLQLLADVRISLSSFQGRWNGIALVFVARILIAFFCRAVR